MIWWLLLLPPALALRDLEPPLPVVKDGRTPQELWLNVRLNHFDASNTETFPMRFYYNNEFAGNSNNIVIFVGGQWSISPGWTQQGLAVDVAAAVQAAVFCTEHRHYGQTRPSQDTSAPDLRFLTVDQALGDLAQFIQHVKSDHFENGRYRDGKVVLVGCSYAGTMATWMRLAYPHLIAGAFSDGGPLHAQEDFPEYVEIINDALLSQGGADCLASVEEAMRLLVALLETPNGPATVSQMFNTCSPLAPTPLDLATFFWFGIQETFAYLVQYAVPGDIQDACAVLTNGSPDPVQRLATWVRSQEWAQPCIEARYSEVVAAHTNTSYDHPASAMRLWTYQTCVQFGWYQSTSGRRHPFLDTVPLEYFHQMCRDFFGTSFQEATLRDGIERTNTLFAGWSHLPDHVVSVAGSLDPWAPMGPNTTHATPLAPVYVVEGASHCRAIYSLGSTEEPGLEATKRAVANHLAVYLRGYPLDQSGAHTLVASVVMIVAVLAAFM